MSAKSKSKGTGTTTHATPVQDLINKFNANQKDICCSIRKGSELKKENTLQKIIALTKKLVGDYYDKSPNMGPWSDDEMGQEITHKNSDCVLLWNQARDEVIGYVCFRVEWEIISQDEKYYEFYIYELMVDTKYQRKGYGQFLMNICEQMARTRKCDYLALTVFASNMPAIKCYSEKLGFQYAPNEIEEYTKDYRIMVKYL